ncbi:MAG: DUF433 domain-containing protein [Chloroflexi bacterium]|nr:DUF433 domain-containing protein [Chloroflexota bacterium]MCC6895466.1 DUF433 domain-containing protein [Anaerolineae bacterium]
MAAQDQVLRDRIVVSRDINHGQPRIAGTRIMVHVILDLLAAEKSINEVISEDYYPDLKQEDVLACIAYSNG